MRTVEVRYRMLDTKRNTKTEIDIDMNLGTDITIGVQEDIDKEI